MYYTNEYTVIIPKDGSPNKTIKPGIINAFEAIDYPFTVTSSARILDADTKKQEIILEVGKVYDGFGTKKKQKIKTSGKTNG